MKIKLKEKDMEAIQWKEEVSKFGEVKRFLGEQCTITYESCYLDNYWCLKINDCLKEEKTVVPVGSYVLKLDDELFTVISQAEFKKFFEVI